MSPRRGEPRRNTVKPVDLAGPDGKGCLVCGCKQRALRHRRMDMPAYHAFESAPKLCIEIIEYATGKVEKKLGPYSTVREVDKADSGVNRNLNHERFYTRFTT